MRYRLGLMLVALVACLVVALPATPMNGTDILLTSSPAVNGARLHLHRYRDGYKSYDVNPNGTGVITFYRRAENSGGYPRGAVIQTWVYQCTDEPFNTGDATAADSVAITTWGTATQCIVRPIP